MPINNRTFRVFISSTFSDMQSERRILQRNAFPKLERYCELRGAKFQVVDLRWGVNEEAVVNQRTLQICFKEIERCQNTSPKPNFLILLGNKYGWQPVPEKIPEHEMRAILSELDSDETKLLNEWYKLDTNKVPGEYILQPRSETFREYQAWEPVETNIRSILRKAVQNSEIDAKSRHKYNTSATHQEILMGALNTDVDTFHPQEHVFAFIRTIHDLPNNDTAAGYLDLKDGKPDPEAEQKLNELKANIIGTLGRDNIVPYEAYWKNGHPEYDDLQAFNDLVYQKLVDVIDIQLQNNQEIEALEIEIGLHNTFRKKLTKYFRGRDDTLNTVRSYLLNKEEKRVIALMGESGSGKSAIMGKLTKHSEEELGIVISRFIGVTSDSSNIINLLQSVCRQIAREFDTDPKTLTPDNEESSLQNLFVLSDVFKKCLDMATEEKPVIVFLDSLDQLSDTENAQDLSWLPENIPPYASLVVSSLPYLQEKLSNTDIVSVPKLPETEARVILDLWLQSLNRKLTYAQYNLLIERFSKTQLPLYLKLAFEQASNWYSYGQYDLRSDVPGIINDLFDELESSFPKDFVKTAVCYMLSGRYKGLTENEILEILAFDPEYWETFVASAHKDHQKELTDLKVALEESNKENRSFMKIPISVWSRLYFDLESYLTERDANGIPIIVFYHRQFNEVLEQRYNLTSDDNSTFEQ